MIMKLFRRKAEPDVQLEQSLEKTRQRGVFSEITRLFDRNVLDDDLYEELEMLLIQADVGVESQRAAGHGAAGAGQPRPDHRSARSPARSCARR